jgi:phosphomannomutase
MWGRYGFHGTRQISVRTTSVEQINGILKKFREQTPKVIGPFSVEKFDDLERPTDGLPPTNGVRMYLQGGARVIVRPSGTEPKIKCYIEVVIGGDVQKARVDAETTLDLLERELRKLLTA